MNSEYVELPITPRVIYYEDHESVRKKMGLISYFSPFEVFKDQKFIIDILKDDLKTLGKFNELTITWEIIRDKSQYDIKSKFIIGHNVDYVSNDQLMELYKKKLSESNFCNDEKIFIKEELQFLKIFPQWCYDDFAVLRLWTYFLEEKIKEISKALPKIEKTIDEKKNKLTLRQIALIYRYENWNLTESKAVKVAASYEYYSPSSGKKLSEKWNTFNTPTQRTGTGYKTANDIRKIIPLLTEKAQKTANKELIKAEKNQSKKKSK